MKVELTSDQRMEIVHTIVKTMEAGKEAVCKLENGKVVIIAQKKTLVMKQN